MEGVPQNEQLTAEPSVEDLQSSIEVLSEEVAEMKEELLGYHNRDLTRAEFDAANRLAYELTVQELEVTKLQDRIKAAKSAMPVGIPEDYLGVAHIPEAADTSYAPPRSAAA